MTDYKTFYDLEFKEHARMPLYSTQARMDFPNGYGVSVVTGQYAYTDENGPYELAVMRNGELCYTTPITDDVLGYLTAEDVTRIMKQIQDLPTTKKENDDVN